MAMGWADAPLTVLSQGPESPVLLAISPSWRLWDCAGGYGWVIYVLLAQAVGWPGSRRRPREETSLKRRGPGKWGSSYPGPIGWGQDQRPQA